MGHHEGGNGFLQQPLCLLKVPLHNHIQALQPEQDTHFLVVVAFIRQVQGDFQIVFHFFRIANLDLVVDHLLVTHEHVVPVVDLRGLLNQAQNVPHALLVFPYPDIVPAHKVEIGHFQIPDLGSFPVVPLDGMHHLIHF